jgi:hypothetical protein
MPASIRTLILASVLLMAPAPAVGDSNAAPPVISRPRPAPDTPPDVPPLPPAQFDPSLAVGGDQVKARKIETRLSVEVNLNGRGSSTAGPTRPPSGWISPGSSNCRWARPRSSTV